MNPSMTDLLAQVSNGSADTPYTVSADWGQGRATFGGLLGGMIYTAMRREVDSARALYSFMLSFVGSVAMSEPFTITVSTLRTGRSTIHRENDSLFIQNPHRLSVGYNSSAIPGLRMSTLGAGGHGVGLE